MITGLAPLSGRIVRRSRAPALILRPEPRQAPTPQRVGEVLREAARVDTETLGDLLQRVADLDAPLTDADWAPYLEALAVAVYAAHPTPDAIEHAARGQTWREVAVAAADGVAPRARCLACGGSGGDETETEECRECGGEGRV